MSREEATKTRESANGAKIMTGKTHQTASGSKSVASGEPAAANPAAATSPSADPSSADPSSADPSSADPCERQIRLRTSVILSLLAALFGVGLIAMEAVYRVRQSQDLAPLGASAQAQELVVEVRETSVQAANAEVASSESTGADSDSKNADSGRDSGAATDAEALADAQQRIAELEREGERLREDLAEHQSALESGELAIMEAQRQLEAAQANAGAARCGALLADLGAMDLNTRLTDSGLRIALSSGDLQFASGSADLTEDTDRERLQALAAWLDDYPDLQVRVIGYTDASGREDANQALSAERAEAVREALIASGVSPEQLSAEGRGEQEPIADNATPEGREQNRRVELLLETTKQDS
ncbi:hypothetical protein CCR91_21615 [Thiorhodovibrio winogradskyi]|nr:hypothetical protein [Thiorhodovibrio winogradskyi]